MKITAELLPWDSEFWGFRVGRVAPRHLDATGLASLQAWAKEQEITCLYSLVEADDPITATLLEDGGFRLVDVRVTLARAVTPGPPSGVPIRIRGYRPSDRDVLLAQAGANHTDTRFWADPRFPREGCQRLYSRWMEQSCDNPSTMVLVAELDREVAGYITCESAPDGGRASIGLLGVAAHARGQGLGAALVNHGLWYIGQSGGHHVSVVTQGRNVGAQRIYQRSGFLTSRTELWFHWWRTSAMSEGSL